MVKNDLKLKNPSKKAEKCFIEDAARFNPFSFEVNALQFELRRQYPYKCRIDITHNQITFLNRDYLPVGLRESAKADETSWYKFDSKQFDLKKHEWPQVENCTKQGVEFMDFWLYYDGNKPWLTQKNFIDYMNKLNYLESLMGEVSPFIKRYILIVNRAYDFSKQISKSNN